MTGWFLRVAVPVPLRREFDYALPADADVDAGAGRPERLVGTRVRVPFGRRQLVGMVTAVGADDGRAEGLKPALALLDQAPLFDEELRRSLAWAASYYHHPPGEVLSAALPAMLRRGEPVPALTEPALALTAAGRQTLADGGPRPGPGRELLEALVAGPLPLTAVAALGDRVRAAAGRLRRRGWIDRCELAPSPRRAPVLAGPPLNPDQQVAVDRLHALLAAGGYVGVLLEGVTGSGKTEVYLRAIEQVLAAGRQALVLVPEIALTPQALRRYRERLGATVIGLHSGLGDGARARGWALARSGQPCVVLGTRSAVFTPLPNAGLIVVDEEHDGSYKQGDGFRYQARDLALVRGRALSVPVVLGSATPSLESLALVADGRLQRLALPARAMRARPPSLRLLDLRGQRLRAGLAEPSLAALTQTLARGEQALVFRNRRGYAPLLRCSGCGWHADCPRCDRPLTLHLARTFHEPSAAAADRRGAARSAPAGRLDVVSATPSPSIGPRTAPRRDFGALATNVHEKSGLGLGALVCHHCGHRRRPPSACPECATTPLDTRGVGTERIEAELLTCFPGHPVIRVDRDSVRSAARLDAAVARVEQGEPAILVGTQLLAKGHDWPALTLVVIVDADGGLFSPDFRAPERLAQLLTQVAGRAGRGDRAGEVIVQTRQPEHPFWPGWLAGGHAAIAQAELAERRLAGLPPFRQQALLAAEAAGSEALDAFFQAALALPEVRAQPDVERLGPLPAPMPRRAGHHRAQLLLAADSRPPLHRLLDAWLPALADLRQARQVRWSIDVDPYDLY